MEKSLSESHSDQSLREHQSQSGGAISLFQNMAGRFEKNRQAYIAPRKSSEEGGTFAKLSNPIDSLSAVENTQITVQPPMSEKEIAGGLPHDFNNLLQVVRSALNIIQRYIESGRTDDFNFLFESAFAAMDRAGILSRQLADGSQSRAADMNPVDVNSVVIGMTGLLQHALGSSIEILFVPGNEQLSVVCDRHHLESTILNLAINARDAMPDGGKLIIETYRADLALGYPDLADQAYACICVTDSGVGMTPEVAARAFEPYYTTKPRGAGTGIGLAMVRAFAHRHRGHAELKSVLGKGTSLRLFLPARQYYPR